MTKSDRTPRSTMHIGAEIPIFIYTGKTTYVNFRCYEIDDNSKHEGLICLKLVDLEPVILNES